MPQMNSQEMIQTFESILAEKLGLDPAACREGEDWWRFRVGDLDCQGGIHYHDFRIVCTLCEIDCDADYDALYGAIADRNGELGAGPARFIEEDNYLHVRGLIPLDAVDRAALAGLIDAVAAVADSNAAANLRGNYRQW